MNIGACLIELFKVRCALSFVLILYLDQILHVRYHSLNPTCMIIFPTIVLLYMTSFMYLSTNQLHLISNISGVVVIVGHSGMASNDDSGAVSMYVLMFI